MSATIKQAEHTQARNDLYWKLWAGDDGCIRWVGYDDRNWWNNVATTDGFRNRVGKSTGKTYRLSPETGEVEVSA